MNSERQLSYLYVEDDASSRQVMRLILGRVKGIQNLFMFDNSLDFMTHLYALPMKPDVILLDIHIKPVDGFEMLRMLQADPDYRESIVVAITAGVVNEEVERLRSAGFNGAISKPLSITGFPILIERILAGETIWHIV